MISTSPKNVMVIILAGFTPSTFTSSKEKRQTAMSNRTADMYMDEEDISGIPFILIKYLY